ncbi:response regulator transcription factor [Anaerolineales bacterium HSG6]|nr:response regulator transcription factor [Anaerolineales bacterium HSG6]MDM8532821.1 response regulator transcription factor [Anaerolineales bacterium HSG25]
MKIFIVADSQDECELFQFALRHAGLETVTSINLKHVLNNWSHNWANLILLAVDDPALILEEIKQIRAITQVPLVIIIDPPAEVLLCTMLQSGADLVFERPTSLRVLSSYIQTLLRRTGAIPTFVLPTLELNEVKLDPSTRTVTVAGQKPCRLTPLEFNLLYVLITNPKQVIPTNIIVERVWGYSDRGDRELVRGLVSRLRHKLEPGSKYSRFIKTIPGVGYQFSLDG